MSIFKSVCLYMVLLSSLFCISCTKQPEIPSIPEYELVVSVDDMGSGSINPSGGIYPEGSEVTVIAYPSPRYRFVSWSGNSTSNSPSITVVMDSNMSLTAMFERIQYELTTVVVPALGGTVEPDYGIYGSDSEVILTAIPSEGYEFVSWVGDVPGTEPSLSLILDSDKEIEAHFEKIRHQLTMEVLPSGAGNITPAAGYFEHNEVVMLTAAPAPVGWAFSHWEGGISSDNSTVEIDMTGDIHLTACFTPVTTYTFTVTILPIRDSVYGGEVELIPKGGVYNENTEVLDIIKLAPATKFTKYSFVSRYVEEEGTPRSIRMEMYNEWGIPVPRGYTMDEDKHYFIQFKEEWVCPYGDEAVFKTKEELINHINQYHPGEELPE